MPGIRVVISPKDEIRYQKIAVKFQNVNFLEIPQDVSATERREDKYEHLTRLTYHDLLINP